MKNRLFTYERLPAATASSVFFAEVHHQVQLFPALDGSVSFWRQMALASVSCRLWIEVACADDPDQSRVLISGPSELERLVPECEITRIGLLSPGHVNGTGKWSLDPLAQLWLCQASLPRGDTCRGWIHVLEDGRELADCSGMDSIFDFHKTELMYRAAGKHGDRPSRALSPTQTTKTAN